MLLALLFFLVCGFVGAVILGSATTNAQKQQGIRAQQQAYESVSSAARLVRDTLDGLTLQGQEHWKEYHCGSWTKPKLQDVHTDEKQKDFFQGETRYDDRIAALVLEGAEQVYDSQTVYIPKTAFTGWTRTFTVEDGVCPVEVTVEMRENYQLIFTLHPQEETLQDLYGMMLVCSAETPVVEETVDERESCRHTYWVDDPLQYGGPVQKTVSIPISYHTRTTSITWRRGTILKGENSNAEAA